MGNGLRSRDSLHMKASERIIDWTERFYLFIHFVCIPIGEKYLFKKIQRILSCYLLLAQMLPALGTPPKQAGPHRFCRLPSFPRTASQELETCFRRSWVSTLSVHT